MTDRSPWSNPDFHTGLTEAIAQMSKADSFSRMAVPPALTDPTGFITREDVHLNLIAMRNQLFRIRPDADFRPTFCFVKVAPEITIEQIAEHVLNMTLLMIEYHDSCTCHGLFPRVERISHCRICLARAREHVLAFLDSIKTYNYSGSIRAINDASIKLMEGV